MRWPQTASRYKGDRERLLVAGLRRASDGRKLQTPLNSAFGVDPTGKATGSNPVRGAFQVLRLNDLARPRVTLFPAGVRLRAAGDRHAREEAAPWPCLHGQIG